MLLFDDSKKLEKALGEEAASVIAHVFEQANEKWRQELATKADLIEVKSELRAEISSMRVEMKEMENRILKWLVGGFLTQSALLVAVLAVMK